MIPSQIARHHCANFDTKDGSCTGVYYNNDLSVKCCKPLSKCLLFPEIKRCAYFEEIIMPMKLDATDQREKAAKQAEFDKGVLQYRIATGLEKSAKNPVQRICPRCKSREMEAGKKLCYVC